MNTRALVHLLGTAALLAVLASPVSATAVINIINLDGPGEGLNDPTPAAPVGGNPGTTIGQQRLLCLQRAAEIWGAALTSTVPINIQVQFNPRTGGALCMAAMGMNITPIANHPALEFQGYWYVQALANKQAGVDLDPTTNDIDVVVASNFGTPDCAPSYATTGLYYGFDRSPFNPLVGLNNTGGQEYLLGDLLHMFAHGLGFASMTDSQTGEYFGAPDNPLPGICDKFIYDETTGLHWDEMTPAQRVASAANSGILGVNKITWDVPIRYNPDGSVHRGALNFMTPKFMWRTPELLVPFGSGSMLGACASFGAHPTADGVFSASGEAVVVVDSLAPTGDGCETITNAAELFGKIAVIGRGVRRCTFASKVKRAQDAGAIGCIITDNVATPPLTTMGGSDATITIPVMMISQSDSVLLHTAIASGPTHVTMRASPTIVQGIAPSGRTMMFRQPMPWSMSEHWNPADALGIMLPQRLMVPNFQGGLNGILDLTPYYLEDIGWAIPRTTSVPGSGPASRVALASRPNPARTSANVHFELPTAETLQLTLYDVSGRQVRQLAAGAFAAGPHDVAWDGRDAAGRRAAPGIYLVRLKGTRTQATHHLVLVD